jgi:hypothetical protein
MSSSPDERRYTEEEFAVILRTASELGDAGDLTRPGLTLAEIQEVASEVGIPRERIAQAAAMLPVAGAGPASRLLGGHPRQRVERTVPGAVPVAQLARVMDVPRRTLGIQGSVREAVGGVEWHGSTGSTGVVVSLMPRGDETAIQISADRTESMAGFYGGVGLPTAGVISLLLGKLVFGETDAGIVAALVSGLVPGMLLARTLWQRSTQRWRERIHRLIHDVGAEVQDAADASSATSDPSDLPSQPVT